MNCVKCGRETGAENAFCETCLNEMKDYPVKPGTVVHIPPRPEGQNVKRAQSRKKTLTPEEQVLRLKKKIVGLRVMLACMLLLAALLGYGIYRAAGELDVYRFLGQNYSTVETAGETTGSDASQ